MTEVGAFTDATLFMEEALLGVIEMLLIQRLYSRVYGKACTAKGRLWLRAAVVMAFVVVFIKVVFTPPWPSAAPPITVLCSFAFLRHYPSKNSKKVLLCGVLFVISCLWLVMADIVLTPLGSKNYWGVDALLHLVFWLLLELINRMGKYEETDIPYSLWLLLLGIAVCSAAALYTLFYYMVSRDNPYAVTVEIPVMLALLFINLSLFVFFDRFSVLLRDAKEKASLEQRLQMQQNQYQELDRAHQQIRCIEHDMKNYLRTAARLASQRESNAELIAYLDRITGRINETDKVVSTGNMYLDTVLSVKLPELERAGIRVESKIQVPTNMSMSFEQASCIFGNLLDNAKEACQALPAQARWVKIHMEYIHHALFVRIENSSSQLVIWKDGLPVSTKNQAAMHGIGLKNVKKVVEETGTIALEATSASFAVKIALYGL